MSACRRSTARDTRTGSTPHLDPRHRKDRSRFGSSKGGGEGRKMHLASKRPPKEKRAVCVVVLTDRSKFYFSCSGKNSKGQCLFNMSEIYIFHALKGSLQRRGWAGSCRRKGWCDASNPLLVASWCMVLVWCFASFGWARLKWKFRRMVTTVALGTLVLTGIAFNVLPWKSCFLPSVSASPFVSIMWERG